MTFRLGAIALALVLVVAATGCGSKKKAAATTTTAPAVTTTNSSSGSGGGGGSTTTAPTTTAPTTTSSSKPTFSSIKNCTQLESLGKKFSAAIQASTSATGGKPDFTKEEELFKALADASPSAIHGDFETLASAFAASASAFQKANLTPGKTPSATQVAELEAAGKAFSAPKVAAAEQHLEAWAATNCAGVK
jgi:hypothetical protein